VPYGIAARAAARPVDTTELLFVRRPHRRT
jgi:hypothetical protein